MSNGRMHKHRQRQTHRPRYICSNRPHLTLCAAMRPNNKRVLNLLKSVGLCELCSVLANNARRCRVSAGTRRLCIVYIINSVIYCTPGRPRYRRCMPSGRVTPARLIWLYQISGQCFLTLVHRLRFSQPEQRIIGVTNSVSRRFRCSKPHTAVLYGPFVHVMGLPIPV